MISGLSIKEGFQRRWALWAGAVASGLLMAASLPPLEWSGAVWLALTPLLICLRYAAPGQGWRLGLASGLAFWLASIHWLTHVTVLGWIGLSLYCAAYMAVFAALVGGWFRLRGCASSLANALLMAMAPLVWAGLEYLRSILFTGFPWNPLGSALYQNLALIQMASWGGVYAVSALIVLMNTAAALVILRYAQMRGRWAWHSHVELILGVCALGFFLAQGSRALREEPAASSPRV